MKLKLFTLILLLCLSLTACGGGGSDGDGGHGACTELKIANGETCESREIPVVLLRIKTRAGDSTCTGTIITRTSVLTAAHCLEGASQIEVVHRKGEVYVSQGYYNAYYAYKSSYGLSPYDVAILKVSEGFTAAVGISSTPLDITDTIYGGTRLSVFGFGLDERGQLNHQLPKAAYVTFNAIDEGHVITLGIDGYGRPGDSGGPLVYKHSIVGVLSGLSNAYPAFNFFADIRNPENYNFIMSLASDVATKSTFDKEIDSDIAISWNPSSEE